MAKSAVSARLRYLNDSSHLLAASYPRTSALLRSQCDKVALDNEVSLGDSQWREACSACGSIFVPGWTQEVQAKTRRPRRTKRKAQKHKSDNSLTSIAALKKPVTASEAKVVYHCKLCHRETRMPLSTRKPDTSLRQRAQQLPVRIAGHDSHVAATKSTASGEAARQIETTNSGTKKRARSRKLGLQAILANRREGATNTGSTSSFGLNLMDFMKQEKG